MENDRGAVDNQINAVFSRKLYNIGVKLTPQQNPPEPPKTMFSTFIMRS